MPKNTAKTAAGAKGLAQRHASKIHENLLIQVRDQLPAWIADQYQTAAPLNEAIERNSPAWESEIAAMLSSHVVSTVQTKLWHDVTTVRFSDPNIKKAAVRFGERLTKNVIDRNGYRRVLRRDTIGTCDAAVQFSVPTWLNLRLRKAYDGKVPELKRPADALECFGDNKEILLFANIYPSTCRLGEVAQDLANLADAVSWHLAEYDGRFEDPETRVLVITDSEEIDATFSNRYNTLMIGPEAYDLWFPWVEAIRVIK